MAAKLQQIESSDESHLHTRSNEDDDARHASGGITCRGQERTREFLWPLGCMRCSYVLDPLHRSPALRARRDAERLAMSWSCTSAAGPVRTERYPSWIASNPTASCATFQDRRKKVLVQVATAELYTPGALFATGWGVGDNENRTQVAAVDTCTSKLASRIHYSVHRYVVHRYGREARQLTPICSNVEVEHRSSIRDPSKAH